jgi:DNA-binding NarL/FixJ family response regulator
MPNDPTLTPMQFAIARVHAQKPTEVTTACIARFRAIQQTQQPVKKPTPLSITATADEPTPSIPPRVRRIIEHAASTWRIGYNAVMAGRSRRGVAARRDAIIELHDTGCSLQQIARWLNLHHTTVLEHYRTGKKQ